MAAEAAIARLCALLLVSCLCHGVTGRQCDPLFSDRCTCGIQQYDFTDQYVVNCTDNNFQTTSILRNLPNETQVLIFVGNNIPEIPWNIFGTINTLENLKIIDMSRNHIKEIKGKSYHHVSNVQRLILNHNELVVSTGDDVDENYHHPRVLSNFENLVELHLTNAFADNTDAALANDLHDIFVNSNLTRLQKLHLEQNEIMSFRDHRVFCDLPELRDLHLGDNMLTGLNFNISCLKKLRFLDLEGNQLETLTKQELNTLDRINKRAKREQPLVIDLGDNPFSCDCNLFDFHNWLKYTNVTVRNKETLLCSGPRPFIDKAVMKLKISPCEEAPPRNITTKGQKVTMGFLLFFTFVLFVLLISLVYHSRSQLRSKLSPMIEAITKKVQYTTINNRESLSEI